MFAATDRLGSAPVVLDQRRAGEVVLRRGRIRSASASPSTRCRRRDRRGTRSSASSASEHVDALDVAPRIEVVPRRVAGAADPTWSSCSRTDGDPAQPRRVAARESLHDLDPSLALIDAKPMDELRDASLARMRFLTTLLLGFALDRSSCSSVVGVYGVLAHVVAQSHARDGHSHRARRAGRRRCAGSSCGRDWR